MLGLVVVFSFLSCKDDSKPIAKEALPEAHSLLGEWEIYEAYRNEKKTKSLESGKFVFLDDSTVTSNLFSDQNNHNFTKDGNRISIEGDDIIKFLEVKKQNNDTLILTSKMSVFNMVFHLARK